MNAKMVLSVLAVLALTVGCAWAATELSGFTAVPESEAAQIVGGDGPGYECDYTPGHEIGGPERYYPCTNSHDPNNPGCAEGAWCYVMARYGCVWKGSGECYMNTWPYIEYGACAWDAETGACVPDGEVYFDPIDACG
jgi:hypothetical protein